MNDAKKEIHRLQTKIWKEKHPEKQKQYTKKWLEKHPGFWKNYYHTKVKGKKNGK